MSRSTGLRRARTTRPPRLFVVCNIDLYPFPCDGLMSVENERDTAHSSGAPLRAAHSATCSQPGNFCCRCLLPPYGLQQHNLFEGAARTRQGESNTHCTERNGRHSHTEPLPARLQPFGVSSSSKPTLALNNLGPKATNFSYARLQYNGVAVRAEHSWNSFSWSMSFDTGWQRQLPQVTEQTSRLHAYLTKCLICLQQHPVH